MLCLFGLLASYFLSPTPVTASFGMTPQQFWRSPWATDQWFPMVGDADGDGRADLLAFWPAGDGSIQMARTSTLGKPTDANVALGGFGHDGLTAACGPFARTNAADILAVYTDGSVRVAWGMAVRGNQYQHNDLIATIPAAQIPHGRSRAAIADFDADGKVDVMVLDGDGNLLLLQNQRGADGVPHFAPHTIATKLKDVKQFSAGVLEGNQRGQLVWLDGGGSLYRAAVNSKLDDLEAPTLLTKVSPNDHMVVGHFRGAKESDILVGQQLLAAGDPKAIQTMPDIPTPAITKDDGAWVAADIDGNGKDDLVRFRRGPERFSGNDTYVHFSYDSGDRNHGYISTTNDGLLDIWKTGEINPGGLDLRAMGCKVGHRDVIVEVERFENKDINNVKANMDRVAKFFAALPIKNPDGTNGITMHFLYPEPWKLVDHDKVMGNFDGYFPRREHRGIIHSMFDEDNGPLVSAVNADRGHFNQDWHTFVHEIGHQFNLSHEGWWGPANCALYPSLMSYTYSYNISDDGEKVCYSDGLFASFVINELDLSEYLPYPIEKLKFLSGSPYHFHIQPSSDGKGTLVDWNWNGVFGEDHVVASVNYDHGTRIGRGYEVGKAQSGLALVNHNGRLLLFYGQGATRLLMKTWLGKDRDTEGGNWSGETVVEESDITGDPVATYLNGVTWVAYPSMRGVAVRAITLDANGSPKIGPAQILPDTRGDEPALTTLNGQIAVLLWRLPTVSVMLRLYKTENSGLTLASSTPLDVVSDAPVAACEGANGSLWVSRIETKRDNNPGKTQETHILQLPDGTMKEAEREVIDGDYQHRRPALIWEMEKGLESRGRLYHFSGCAGASAAAQYITMNVPYRDIGNGWLVRRFLEPSFASSSTPGACFYNNNIVYALRQHDGNKDHNDTIGVFFYGNGASPGLMGDFDDVGLVRDYGLSRSIREVQK